jgi:hypothetical protein
MHATSTIAPQDPQYTGALRRAYEMRLARASMRRRVAAGEVDVREVVLSCPRELLTTPLVELLAAQRRWGDKKSRDPLAEVGAVREQVAGDAGPRQRGLVAERLS